MELAEAAPLEQPGQEANVNMVTITPWEDEVEVTENAMTRSKGKAVVEEAEPKASKHVTWEAQDAMR